MLRFYCKMVLISSLLLSSSLIVEAAPKNKGKNKNKNFYNQKKSENEDDNDVKVIINEDDNSWPGKGKKVPFGQRKKFRKGPPDHAPAWGYRKKKGNFKTWHFPGSDVYYREKDKQYIYLEKGEWRIGHELPDWINVNYDNSITLENADQRLKKVLEKIGLD